MHTLFYLLDKEWRQFLRNPFLPKMAVMFPLMVMLVIPWVTTMDVRHVNVAVIDGDRSPASRRLIQKIGASDYFTLRSIPERYDDALEALEAGDASSSGFPPISNARWPPGSPNGSTSRPTA